MALSFAIGFDGLHFQAFDVIATADADTVLVIPHGMQRTPFVFITPAQQAVGELSAWAVTGITDTDVTVEKSVAVGSGDPAIQLRVNVIAQQAPVIG